MPLRATPNEPEYIPHNGDLYLIVYDNDTGKVSYVYMYSGIGQRRGEPMATDDLPPEVYLKIEHRI